MAEALKLVVAVVVSVLVAVVHVHVRQRMGHNFLMSNGKPVAVHWLLSNLSCQTRRTDGQINR